MFRALCCWLWGCALVGLAPAAAQDAALLDVYGRGVHAYFSGNAQTAHAELTAAIDGGSRDPRCYYFRGLACERLGRAEDARQDYLQAAALETADSDHFYNVSKALERIQGSARLNIERYRSQARVVAVRREQERRYQRYQRTRTAEPDVTVPMDSVEPEPADSAAPQEPAPEEPSGESTEGEMPETTTVEEPTGEQPAAEEPNPFDKPSSNEIQAEAPEEPAAPAEKAAPSSTPAEAPAGDSKTSDPFGKASGKPADADMPAAADGEQPADDAEDTATPLDGKQAAEGETPAEESSDDTTDSSDAEKSAESSAEKDQPADDQPATNEDPFGESSTDEPAKEEATNP